MNQNHVVIGAGVSHTVTLGTPARSYPMYDPEDVAAGVALAAMFSPIPVKVRAGRWLAVMANADGVAFDTLYGHFLGLQCGYLRGEWKTRGECAAAIASGSAGAALSVGFRQSFAAACRDVCEAMRVGS